MRDLDEIVRQYLDEAERICAAVNGKDQQKAKVLREYVRQIREYLDAADSHTRQVIEHTILFTVGVEDLTTGHLWKKPVDSYIERIEHIRKTPTITAADIREAEKQFSTRAKQAAHLGIGPRHYRRLRSELLIEN